MVVSSSRVNGHSRKDGVLRIEAAGCCSGVEARGHWTQPDNTAVPQHASVILFISYITKHTIK